MRWRGEGISEYPNIRKMTMTSKFSDMTSLSNFFDVALFVLFILVTDPSLRMTIFFYKGLTRNPEIGNTSVWVLPNIWRLGWVMDTKFGTNVSNKMLLYAAKFQDYSFYRFWNIKGKPTEELGRPPSPPPIPTRSGLNSIINLKAIVGKSFI